MVSKSIMERTITSLRPEIVDALVKLFTDAFEEIERFEKLSPEEATRQARYDKKIEEEKS